MKKKLTFGETTKKSAHTFLKQVSKDIYNVNGKYVDIETLIHSLKAKAKIK